MRLHPTTAVSSAIAERLSASFTPCPPEMIVTSGFSKIALWQWRDGSENEDRWQCRSLLKGRLSQGGLILMAVGVSNRPTIWRTAVNLVHSATFSRAIASHTWPERPQPSSRPAAKRCVPLARRRLIGFPRDLRAMKERASFINILASTCRYVAHTQISDIDG